MSRMELASLQLETPRLLLRPTQPEDFEAWAAFMADADSARFIGGVQSRPVAWRGFLTMAGAWVMQGSRSSRRRRAAGSAASARGTPKDGPARRSVGELPTIAAGSATRLRPRRQRSTGYSPS